MAMTFRALLASLVLTSLVIAGCESETLTGSAHDAEREAVITRVIDGDTIEIRPAIDGAEDVRLIGVDTPETAGSPRGAQPYGEEASEFTEERLEGRRVTLRFDVEKKDQYGRLLAYVYLPDGMMFNETLLREGYAQVATFPPNVRHLGSFETAQRAAREADRGIWGLPRSQLCRLTDRGNGIGGGC
jgi:micrococcal nuclease